MDGQGKLHDGKQLSAAVGCVGVLYEELVEIRILRREWQRKEGERTTNGEGDLQE